MRRARDVAHIVEVKLGFEGTDEGDYSLSFRSDHHEGRPVSSRPPVPPPPPPPACGMNACGFVYIGFRTRV